MAWTAPRTWVTSEVVTSSIMNTHVRDNFLYLGGPDSRGSSLPGSPVDGQVYDYLVDSNWGIIWRFRYRQQTTPTSRNGTTANGSATITMADTSSLAVGMGVTGTNVPLGAIIVSIVASTSITIDRACTGAATNSMSFLVFPWEFVGGPPLMATEVATSQSTTSTSYTDLATTGPDVTVPLHGVYQAEFGCLISTASGGQGWMSLSPDLVAAEQGWAYGVNNGFGATAIFNGMRRVQLGVSIGSASPGLVRSKYKSTATSATFVNRILNVLPVKVK